MVPSSPLFSGLLLFRLAVRRGNPSALLTSSQSGWGPKKGFVCISVPSTTEGLFFVFILEILDIMLIFDTPKINQKIRLLISCNP